MKKWMFLPLLLALILIGCSSEEVVFEPVTVSGFEVEVQLELSLSSAPFDQQGNQVWGEDLEGEALADLLEELDIDVSEALEGEFILRIELLSYALEAEETDELELTFLTPAVDYLFLNAGETVASFEDITFNVAGVFVYEITQIAEMEESELGETDDEDEELNGEWLLDDASVLITITVIEDLETEHLIAEVEQEGDFLFINVLAYDVSEMVQEALMERWEESTTAPPGEDLVTNQPGSGSSSSSSGNTGIPEDSAVTLSHSEALSYLALVNRHFRLSSNFSPGDLSVVNVQSTHGTHHLRVTAARAAENLFAAAANDGHTLIATSGYRSFATQQATHQHWINERGEAEARRISARPGHSEHQLGLALDITNPTLGCCSSQFSSTSEGIWVRNNAHRFGFIIRYPAGREADTGFIYEPWHIRYVGVGPATTIHNGNLILEDFLR